MKTNRFPDSGDDAPETQAIGWLVRLTSGDMGPVELKKFEHWRRASPDNEAALNTARQLWLRLGKPLDARYADYSPSDAARIARADAGHRPRFRLYLATALLLIVAGISQQWLTNWRHSYTTAVGELRTVALHDGSTMWLNTQSAVDVDVNESQRRITLARGEAFFDVKRDPRNPFIVDAGVGQVKVLGTAFSVQRQNDDTIVTVLRGRVRVSGGNAQPIEITPNEQVRVRADDETLHVEQTNASQQLGWHHGQLLFENQTVSEIISELRRYDSRLLILEPGIGRQRLSASIKLSSLDDWYNNLAQTLSLRITYLGPVVWIRKNAQAAQ